MKDALAIIGAIIATFSTIPYIIDILKKRTRPNIVSWFTWTLLTGVAMAAAYFAGEYRTALLMLGSTVCTTAVVLLGLKFGTAKFSLFDALCQIGAIVGLILWLLFNSPSIAIIASVTIDFIAMLPTLRHAWLAPDEETWQTFTIGVVAPVFTIVSLSTFNTASLLYPLYLVLANGVIAFAIVYKRKKLGIRLIQNP